MKESELEYVNKVAQIVITYNEVNAAKLAWCNALAKIGCLKRVKGNTKNNRT